MLYLHSLKGYTLCVMWQCVREWPRPIVCTCLFIFFFSSIFSFFDETCFSKNIAVKKIFLAVTWVHQKPSMCHDLSSCFFSWQSPNRSSTLDSVKTVWRCLDWTDDQRRSRKAYLIDQESISDQIVSTMILLSSHLCCWGPALCQRCQLRSKNKGYSKENRKGLTTFLTSFIDNNFVVLNFR